MKHKPIFCTAGLLLLLALTACQTNPAGSLNNRTTAAIPGDTAQPSITNNTSSNTTTTSKSNSIANPLTNSPGTNPAAGDPNTATPPPSEEFWTEGNPKAYALAPVLPDLAKIRDESAPGTEEVKQEFADYLTRTYPDHDWLVANITDYDSNGVSYQRGEGFSHTSLDTIVWVYKNLADGSLTDSFQRDVVQRMNTMTRWRYEFQAIADGLTTPIYPLTEASVDVSYDYYEENIPRIKLDQALDPKSTEYQRAVEIYFRPGLTDPEQVPEMADVIFNTFLTAGYVFTDYYVYMTNSDQTKFDFLVPTELIGSPSFRMELKDAMTDPADSSNSIRPLPTNGEPVQGQSVN